jgi:glycerate 2-kinase
MKIVIAPDSFKECLGALQVATALRDGLRQVLPETQFDLIPMADGGEGTVDALIAATGGTLETRQVSGPLGDRTTARFGLFEAGRKAIIELAAASGLGLLPRSLRNPMLTSTFGTGELIRVALDSGARTLIIGLGGSATLDGGVGLLQALGLRLWDGAGNEIEGPMTGGRLDQVQRIDIAGLDSRLRECQIIAACDVDNPLCGEHGAAAVFGPQKGATAPQIAAIDCSLGDFYRLAASLGLPVVDDLSGAGAAGGAGAALAAFLGARIQPGVDVLIEATSFAERLAGAHCVITGEGRLDRQTLHGKAPAGVARVARAARVPVIAVGGSVIDEEVLFASGLFSALEGTTSQPLSQDEAIRNASRNLYLTGVRIGYWLKMFDRSR